MLVYVQNKEILTLKETALLLGISRTTLYRLRKNGDINFKVLGGNSGHVDHPIPVYVDQSF